VIHPIQNMPQQGAVSDTKIRGFLTEERPLPHRDPMPSSVRKKTSRFSISLFVKRFGLPKHYIKSGCPIKKKLINELYSSSNISASKSHHKTPITKKRVNACVSDK